MPVEFLGIGGTHDGSETTARSGASFDKDYTIRLAAAHEENGWDRILFAYGSGSPDPAQVAAFVATRRERIQLLLAHRLMPFLIDPARACGVPNVDPRPFLGARGSRDSNRGRKRPGETMPQGRRRKTSRSP